MILRKRVPQHESKCIIPNPTNTREPGVQTRGEETAQLPNAQEILGVTLICE